MATGAAIVDVLAIRDRRDKSTSAPKVARTARAHVASARLAARQVFFPGAENHDATSYDPTRTPHWVQQFIAELEMFPNGAHDDRVDALTHAIVDLANPGPRARPL